MFDETLFRKDGGVKIKKAVQSSGSNHWGTGAETFEQGEERERVNFRYGRSPDAIHKDTLGGTLMPGYNWKPEKNIDMIGVELNLDIIGVDDDPKVELDDWNIYNPEALTQYTINAPEFVLCSVQLSDAVQRALNEYSATNGLEIVYADYDLTTAPVSGTSEGTQTSIYTEVRKSASRALAAYARITPVYSKYEIERSADSNASAINFAEDVRNGQRGWCDYQWQLGSLYFPQQKVAGTNAVDFDTLAYTYTLEAAGKLNGSSSCFLTLKGDPHPNDLTASFDTSMCNPCFNPLCSKPDILSQERFYKYGKAGSFCGGGHVVSVSLERSTMFNMSGIPINNSRVLALRGNFSGLTNTYTSGYRMNIYLKYVKLCRVFLLNTEVEQ